MPYHRPGLPRNVPARPCLAWPCLALPGLALPGALPDLAFVLVAPYGNCLLAAWCLRRSLASQEDRGILKEDPDGNE